ncbi:MAG: hypothetical protein RMJ28_06970 [Nitrososphaerota archaeon]|nr:hypothetical protein [Candidatus Calditenuaceae archaeon]MDW8073955.1 hypothetical protein [Nitrososphaerota archaeon]
MPCIYRIRADGRFLCGARPPLTCSRSVCPFGPTLWERLIKHDAQSQTLWMMPEMRIIKASELDLGKLEPGAYLVKSVSLSVGGRRRCRSGRR